MDSQNKVLYCSFNYDASLFALGTEQGFVICRTSPFKVVAKQSNFI